MMLLPQSVEDYMWALELTALLHSLEVRPADTAKDCPVCGERIDLLEDRTPILTSSGTSSTWRTRRPEAHRRACFFERRDQISKHVETVDVDLWERDF